MAVAAPPPPELVIVCLACDVRKVPGCLPVAGLGQCVEINHHRQEGSHPQLWVRRGCPYAVRGYALTRVPGGLQL